MCSKTSSFWNASQRRKRKENSFWEHFSLKTNFVALMVQNKDKGYFDWTQAAWEKLPLLLWAAWEKFPLLHEVTLIWLNLWILLCIFHLYHTSKVLSDCNSTAPLWAAWEKLPLLLWATWEKLPLLRWDGVEFVEFYLALFIYTIHSHYSRTAVPLPPYSPRKENLKMRSVFCSGPVVTRLQSRGCQKWKVVKWLESWYHWWGNWMRNAVQQWYKAEIVVRYASRSIWRQSGRIRVRSGRIRTSSRCRWWDLGCKDGKHDVGSVWDCTGWAGWITATVSRAIWR